jgi:RNA polymerase sigma-70 factor (ECF subfamily)
MLASVSSAKVPRDFQSYFEEGNFREALACVAREHGRAVGRVCFVLLRNQEEANEVAQETFLAAFGALSNYRGDGSVRAWLFGIARRQCARRLERGKRAHLELVEDSVTDTSTPEKHAASSERSERLRDALAKLKPSERDAVVLHYVAGLSFREIATALDVSEEAARKRASRALFRLRSMLKPEDLEV